MIEKPKVKVVLAWQWLASPYASTSTKPLYVTQSRLPTQEFCISMVPSVWEENGSEQSHLSTLAHKMDKKLRAGCNVANVKHDPKVFTVHGIYHKSKYKHKYKCLYMNQKYITDRHSWQWNPMALSRVTLLVPACQPGLEEMENLRGNLRKFERK